MVAWIEVRVLVVIIIRTAVTIGGIINGNVYNFSLSIFK